MAKGKQLKFWNIRHQVNFKGTMYVAAYSRSHASRLILEFIMTGNYEPRDVKSMNKEIRDYGNETWGNEIDALVPNPTEPGLWSKNNSVSSTPVIRLL